jgi:acyl-CoA reductase-like NAD-dependent aldehyde dehydrogenase
MMMISYAQNFIGGRRVDPLGSERIEVRSPHDGELVGVAPAASKANVDLAVARRVRAGFLNINGKGPDFLAPFGGFKWSGIGREFGAVGLGEYAGLKAITL